MLNGVKNKKLFEAFSAEFFLFSQGVIHFALRFTYSLDFFGSFLDQAKNEQVEIRITIGESDFVSIVAKKKATIPPKSDCASCIDQGFTALATKMPHLRCFWVGKDLPFVLSKPALIFNSLRACPDLKLAQGLP